MAEQFSYEKAGVNIDTADAAKRAMAKSLATEDQRVLNKIGAFASLFDGRFPGYEHPVLVLKTEEPGSKQKLAFQHKHVRSICYDMINHLINDIIVMGAKPLSVQDAIICGKLEKEVVNEIVDGISSACREQGCTLTGGETSEQPGVLEAGIYILTSSIVGVVEKSKIIDGSKIREGDLVLSVASNGLHTNGYSLVRALMAANPDLAGRKVEGETFIEAILKPHTCYYQAFRDLFDNSGLHGLAHITGGGIEGNLNRVLPDHLNAVIDLGEIRVLPIFKLIRQVGQVDDRDMLRTFNMGVGMTLVVDPNSAPAVSGHLHKMGHKNNVIGRITQGEKKVVYQGQVNW
jgi:phosphoribosylformylglycinamidine cyclo-ligase